MMLLEFIFTCGSGRFGKSFANRSYIPSLLLKSGTPQLVETPAPHKTIIFWQVLKSLVKSVKEQTFFRGRRKGLKAETRRRHKIDSVMCGGTLKFLFRARSISLGRCPRSIWCCIWIWYRCVSVIIFFLTTLTIIYLTQFSGSIKPSLKLDSSELSELLFKSSSSSILLSSLCFSSSSFAPSEVETKNLKLIQIFWN